MLPIKFLIEKKKKKGFLARLLKLTENPEANIRIMKVEKSMELNIETVGKYLNTTVTLASGSSIYYKDQTTSIKKKKCKSYVARKIFNNKSKVFSEAFEAD